MLNSGYLVTLLIWFTTVATVQIINRLSTFIKMFYGDEWITVITL